MVARLSVGSRYTEPLLMLLGFGAAVTVGLSAYYATKGKPDPALVAGAAVAVVLFLFRWWLVGRGRRWISPTEIGFILEDRHGTHSVDNDDITDLATESVARYSSGVARATVRHGTITLRDGRVPFRYEFPLDQPDPLGFFLDRLLTRLADRAAAVLDRGEAVRGDGWELTTGWLLFRSGRRDRQVTVEDIATADVVDGHVCVWARGEPHPSARIPAGSTNALVLLDLLGRLVQDRGAGGDDSVGGLGRVLFERGQSANLSALFLVTLVFAAMFAGLGAVAADLQGALVGVAVFGVIGSPVFLVVLVTAGNVFRCHARGVFRRTAWWTRELRFEDVGRFRYAATRHYYNGAYVGTAVRMSFAPRPEAGGRVVTYSASIKNGDAELERLREHVSRVVASHMLRRLDQGRSVGWTDGLRVRREGLEWTNPGGLFSRSATRLIPYDEIAGTDIQEGHFYLYLRGVKKAVYTTPVSADNFFPGLALLEMIRFGAPVGRVGV